MPENARWFSFAYFDGGGSKMNEPLDTPGFWSRAAEGVPKVFPGFIRFPVVARAKKVEGVEPGRVGYAPTTMPTTAWCC